MHELQHHLEIDSQKLFRVNDDSVFSTLELGVWATPEANAIQDNIQL